MSLSEETLATVAATLAAPILAAEGFGGTGGENAPAAVKVFVAVLEELRKHYVIPDTGESIQRSRAILED